MLLTKTASLLTQHSKFSLLRKRSDRRADKTRQSPGIADDVVIAIAAVACIALASVVAAKKVR